jgi:CheY-like chemotaxis protein
VSLAGRRVLIVDDNDTNRRVLEEMSHGWGMRPFAVENGRAAMASVEAAWTAGEPYEVVLLDYSWMACRGSWIPSSCSRVFTFRFSSQEKTLDKDSK